MSVLTCKNEFGNHARLAQRGHSNSDGQGKMVVTAVCAAERSRYAWEIMSVWDTKHDGPAYDFFS